MRTRRFKKEAHKSYLGKLITTALVAGLVAVLSIVGVMANSIPCTVIDGTEIYEFTMMSPDIQDIIDKAVDEGMEPLTERDTTVSEGGAVIVKRGVTVVLENNDKFTALDAYAGDTVAEILVRNEIQVEDSDTLTPSADVVVNDDATIILDTERTFYIFTEEGLNKYTTASCTVAGALEELGITLSENDKLNAEPEDNLKNGMELRVSRGKNITVYDGDKVTELLSFSDDVENALRAAALDVGHYDLVSPDRDTALTEGMEIKVTRTTVKEVAEDVEIAFPVERIETDDLPEGEIKIESEGVKGLKKVSYKEVYDGENLVRREVVSEEVVSEPAAHVILVGVRPKTIFEKAQESRLPPQQSEYEVSNSENTFTDMYGNVIAYKSVMNGNCTAYSIPGGTCSTGVPAQVGVVAVNPRIIPYGTKMYITSDDVVYGYCIAGDTGGFISHGRVLVDLYYNTESECYNFGVRNMTIYILD